MSFDGIFSVKSYYVIGFSIVFQKLISRICNKKKLAVRKQYQGSNSGLKSSEERITIKKFYYIQRFLVNLSIGVAARSKV